MSTYELRQWELDQLMHIPLRRCEQGGCGGWLQREPSYVVSGRTWMDASCDVCGHTVSLPGGRTRERGLSHELVPAGPPAWFTAARGGRDHAQRAAGD